MNWELREITKRSSLFREGRYLYEMCKMNWVDVINVIVKLRMLVPCEHKSVLRRFVWRVEWSMIGDESIWLCYRVCVLAKPFIPFHIQFTFTRARHIQHASSHTHTHQHTSAHTLTHTTCAPHTHTHISSSSASSTISIHLLRAHEITELAAKLKTKKKTNEI